VSASSGLGYGIEIGAGALTGYSKGTWLGVRYLLLDGAFKPGAVVESSSRCPRFLAAAPVGLVVW
jgi:hypothetical protein